MMTTTTQRSDGPSERERRFVEFVQGLETRQDRAALAALRQGLGRLPGTAMDMHRYVVPWLPRDGPQWREDCYYLVASLFAAHRLSWPEEKEEGDRRRLTNLGASFRRLADATTAESVERRFTALLASERRELPEQLRHAVSLLKSKDVPIDWAWLLHDLQQWDRDDRRVQRRWARAFWAMRAAESEGTPEEDTEGQAMMESSVADENDA